MAKLARDGTVFRTEGGTIGYIAPEAGIDNSRETSEYTNAVDIWALGCITHEVLTQVLPFRGLGELNLYCSRPKLGRETMLAKNISKRGIKFVERTLAYPPELRITAGEALDLEWLQPQEKPVAGMETEDSWTGSVLPEGLPSLGGEAANGYSPPGNIGSGFRNHTAATMKFMDQRAARGGLSAPRPVVDNSEYELQRLVREYQALSAEVTMGIIWDLKAPSLNRQTPLAEKEVLYPAYLINIVTREMLNSGFVRESTSFLADIVQSIRGNAVVSEDTAKLGDLGSLTVDSGA